MQIENVPMPTKAQAFAIETPPMPGSWKKGTVKPPKKVKKNKPTKLSPLQVAANEYKEAYKALYGVDARLTFDGTWIRIKGEPQGMNLARLEERTRQLINRKG